MGYPLLSQTPALSGSSQQLTLKKGAPGDQVFDLLCVQLTSYPKGANLCG